MSTKKSQGSSRPGANRAVHMQSQNATNHARSRALLAEACQAMSPPPFEGFMPCTADWKALQTVACAGIASAAAAVAFTLGCSRTPHFPL